MYTYDVQPVKRLIVLEHAALQLDVLANEVVVHVHTLRWISGLHCLGSVISSSTRVYRLLSSSHRRRDAQEGPASNKNMVILLCMHVACIYSELDKDKL